MKASEKMRAVSDVMGFLESNIKMCEDFKMSPSDDGELSDYNKEYNARYDYMIEVLNKLIKLLEKGL